MTYILVEGDEDIRFIQYILVNICNISLEGIEIDKHGGNGISNDYLQIL